MYAYTDWMPFNTKAGQMLSEYTELPKMTKD